MHPRPHCVMHDLFTDSRQLPKGGSAMSAAPTPIEIFCSYAHEDEEWWQKLETHLSLLKRQGLISLWQDRLIAPGTDWAQTIDAHLETASVILLLVSADFLASDYCYGVEMKRALERQEAGEARVVAEQGSGADQRRGWDPSCHRRRASPGSQCFSRGLTGDLEHSLS